MKPLKLILTLLIPVVIILAVYFLVIQRRNLDAQPQPTPTPVVIQTPEEILAGLHYIHAVDWPPVVRMVDGPYACTEAGIETQRAGATTKRVINGKEYCVTVETEGAAGSTYRTYAYATAAGNQVSITTFALRSVQCGNYNEPEKGVCEAEQGAFSPDALLR